MNRSGRSNRRIALAVAALSVLVLTVSGCARDLRAEMDGKKAGEALCDLRNAEDGAEREAAAADLEKQLDDLNTKYAVFTAEDRADIRENLSDLAEHITDGNTTLAQQDLAVLRRSFGNIRDDVSDLGQAAVDGFFQGIDGCLEA